MIRLQDKQDVEAPSGDYPYGSIQDQGMSVDGTPVNRQVYSDIHQFFEKMFFESGLTANGLPDNEANGYQLFEALQNTFTRGVLTPVLNKKIVTTVLELGAWNMDATATITVNTGLDFTKIRAVDCVIRRDDDGVYYNLGSTNATTGVANGSIISYSLSGVELVRIPGGLFDDVAFSNAVINRGFLHVQYEL